MRALCMKRLVPWQRTTFMVHPRVPDPAGRAAAAVYVGLHTFQLLGRQVGAVKIETSQDTGRSAEEERPLQKHAGHLQAQPLPCFSCYSFSQLVHMLMYRALHWSALHMAEVSCATNNHRWLHVTTLFRSIGISNAVELAGCSKGLLRLAREHLETVQVVQLAVLVRQHPVMTERRLGQEAGILRHGCRLDMGAFSDRTRQDVTVQRSNCMGAVESIAGHDGASRSWLGPSGIDWTQQNDLSMAGVGCWVWKFAASPELQRRQQQAWTSADAAASSASPGTSVR